MRSKHLLRPDELKKAAGGDLVSVNGALETRDSRMLSVSGLAQFVASAVPSAVNPLQLEEKMTRLVAELNAQFAESAKLAGAIRSNLR